MNFQRGNSIKKSVGIGRWADYVKVLHAYVHGTIGWGDNTETVRYKVEGIALREFLLAVEQSAPHFRTARADSVLCTYMKHCFFGNNVLRGNPNPVSEEDIEELRAAIWSVSFHVQEGDVQNTRYIESFRGKNVVYEGGIWTMPE